MPSTEKKIYSELAVQDRQRYLEEMMQYESEHGIGANGHGDTAKSRKKVGRPAKHDKPGADSKAHNHDNPNGAGNTTATPTNGHLPVNKMGIHNVMNGDTEGEEMTSHDDEDVRMEEGSEDDQEDEDEEEPDQDDDDDEEQQHLVLREQTNINKGSNTGYSHVEDVDMVERHRAQDTAVAQGLVVSA